MLANQRHSTRRRPIRADGHVELQRPVTFRVDGDVVASSDTSSSETDYTMSMIINVSNVTPGGRYNGVFSAVVVPLY